MFEICNHQKECVSDKSLCATCSRNFMNKEIKDNFKLYNRVCKYEYTDCINDPAHEKHFMPKWYLEQYGDVSPEVAANSLHSCCPKCYKGDLYDDEAK